jgi:small subunit ribosomal protein S6
VKQYELTVLLQPKLEADVEKSLKKLRELIKNNGGEVSKEDNWGKRRLAYAIKREDFAIYICFEVKLPSAALAKISQTLNIDDSVLRYLLVSVDDKIKAKLAEAKKTDAEEKASKE